MTAFVLADNGFGHMNGWGMGMGVTGLILLVLLVGLITWLVVSTTQAKPPERTSRSALDVLDDRYARGEIDRKDYLERRSDLEDRE